jgi:gliding motility-associated-like protein
MIYRLLVWGLLLAVASPAWSQLSANFSADPLSGCAPIRIIFKNESSGNPDKYRWDLGNGTISTSKDPSTTYFTPGTYTIKLTIYKGTDSATVTKSNYVSVFSIPQVDFTGSPLAGCAPLPVRFTDRSVAGSGTISSWRWDFGDGNLSTASNPIHIYRNQGKFKVTLTVRNSEGCINNFSKDEYVSVLDSVKAKFNINFTPSCVLPLTVKFSDVSVGKNIVSWQWDFGDGNTSGAKDPSHIYTQSGTFDVRLVVTNSSGCTDTLTRVKLINAGNLKAAIDAQDSYCANQTVRIGNVATPQGSLDSTIWRVSDGSVYRTKDLVKVFTNPGTYTITQIVWWLGCVDSVSKTVNIIPSPGSDFTASPNESCKPPLTVNFTNTNSGATLLLWDFGNGQTSTDPSPSITYNSYGNFTVKMVVRNSSGCVDTVVKAGAVKINPPNITGILGLPYDGCFPYSATFDPQVTTPEPIASYRWDFGDGTSSTDKNPSKTYTVEGDYRVTLIVATASGCADTIRMQVRGSAKPKADFVAQPLITCPSKEVNFQSLSTGNITRWSWFFGDGGTSNKESTAYLYNDTGNMTVKLVVYNNGCADSLIRQQYVYVYPPLAVFLDSFSCADQSTHFFTNKSIGALTWRWYFGDGDSTNSWDAIHQYKDTGRYNVRLVVADTVCKHEATKTIYVFNEKADFKAENVGGCASNLIRFTAEGPGTHPANISRFEWTINNEDPVVTDTNFLERIFPDTATIQLKLKITDLNGCVDSVTKTVPIVLQNIKANFGPERQNACIGQLVSFQDSSRAVSSNPIVKWIWNFGNSTNDSVFTKAPFQTRYYEPGLYDVQLVVEDKFGCRDTLLRKEAVVVHNSIADFVSVDTLVCLNTPVSFTNLSVASFGVPLTYSWSFGNGKIDSVENPITVYSLAGKYDIRLIIRDVYGCYDTLERPKYITVADARADFAMSDSFSTCPPLLVSFTNKSESNPVNIWNFGNGNSSALLDPSHTYTFPGVFNVNLTVVGVGGCTDSITKQVRIQGPSGIFTYGPLAGCPPLKVDFKANAINTKFYTWDFSDGQSDVTLDSAASHVYDVPGFFVPRLILEDGLGCKLPVQGPDTIRVFNTDAMISKLSKYQFCDTATVSFSDSSTSTEGIARYRWQFGDGTESTERNPVHCYTRPGIYNVVLEVWTLSDCYKTDTLDNPIIIAQSPELDFSGNDPVCVPFEVQYTGYWNNQDTAVMTYKWDFGNGRSSSRLVPEPVPYTTPGVFNVLFSGTNNYGCVDTIMKAIIINDTPRVQADPATTLCRGQSVDLRASGAISYSWSPQRGLSCANCANPAARPDSTIIYRVTGSDVNGCLSSDTVLVQVIQPGNLSVGPGDTICIGESVQLRSQGFDILRWSPTAGLSNPNIGNPIAKPQATTRYTVVGTDILNCFTDSGSALVYVYPIPQFDIVESFIQSDPGAVVPLKTNSSSDIISWKWSPTRGLSCASCPEPFVTITRKDKYTAVVSNAGGCIAQDNVNVEPTCVGESVFVPNTFSPNADGNNDVFYPRGKGVNTIKRMQIFNRWGELMYERSNFSLNDPTAGWNGTYKGVLLTPDVYVYMIDGVCGNNETFNLKGNVTLLR